MSTHRIMCSHVTKKHRFSSPRLRNLRCNSSHGCPFSCTGLQAFASLSLPFDRCWPFLVSTVLIHRQTNQKKSIERAVNKLKNLSNLKRMDSSFENSILCVTHVKAAHVHQRYCVLLSKWFFWWVHTHIADPCNIIWPF
jgi:hypothetical protein